MPNINMSNQVDINNVRNYATPERADAAMRKFIEEEQLEDVWYVISSHESGRYIPMVILSQRQTQNGYHHVFAQYIKPFRIIIKG